MGYARCSTAQQELQSRLNALAEAGCDPAFSEKISTRVKVRPEFVKAMDFARTIKKAVPRQRVIFTVHEMKRLGRGAAELLAIAEDLRHHDIQLELLTGPLQGVFVDDDMADYARSLRANDVPVPQIAQKLIITSGKNKGQRPSVATVYRILAEDTE
ncbi:recombinase family protein [Streptomyces sp. NPDC001020]